MFMSRTVLNLNGECGTSCVHRCEAVGGDVAVCVDAGEDGFLSDCAMLYFTLCVECRGIVGGSIGCEDAQICNLLIPVEGLGWGDGCWTVWGNLQCMQGNSYVGI